MNSQRVFECMKLAKYHIDNIDTLNNLHKKIDKILEKEKLIII